MPQRTRYSRGRLPWLAIGSRAALLLVLLADTQVQQVVAKDTGKTSSSKETGPSKDASSSENASSGKKPKRPKVLTVRESSDHSMHLLPTDDDGVPLVDLQNFLRPGLKEEDFDSQYNDDEDGKQDKEDEEEEEEGKGTVSSGALKKKKKNRGNSTEETGKKEKTKTRRWVNVILSTTEACHDYRKKKREGKTSEKQLKVLEDETSEKISSFLENSLLNYKNNITLMTEFARIVMPSKNGHFDSPFLKECAAMDIPEMRAAWGHFYEVFATVDLCLQHTGLVTEFEGRCFASRMGSALNAYQWGRDTDAINDLWEYLQKVRDKGGNPMIRWEDPMMHPNVMYRGIRNQPIWERKHHETVRHVMELLESNVEIFREELQAVIEEELFGPANDGLVSTGSWSKAVLFDGVWSPEVCTKAPRSCSLLRFELPGRQQTLPYVYPLQEEVTLYHGSPGSHVLPHGGVTNGRINIHIGLQGFENSSLSVFTGLDRVQHMSWSGDRCFAFSDAWQHEVFTGPSDRYVLEVGIMHPDITAESYLEDFKGKTMAGKFGDKEVKRLQKIANSGTKRRRRRRAAQHEEL